MLLIDATYIHESGGKVLLEYLVGFLKKEKKSFFLLADSRLKTDVFKSMAESDYLAIKGSERNRKRFYQNLDKRIQSVFCFSNVPPPIVINKITVFIYFQNTLILSDFFEKNRYTLSNKILLAIRKNYIRWHNQPGYHWIVQTDTMKQKLVKNLGVNNQSVSILPFFNDTYLPVTDRVGEFRFLYVADGVPQKNHIRLLEAWEYLYDNYQMNTELHLTIPRRFTDLHAAITRLVNNGLKIVNHPILDREALNELYSECRYLVFPSLAESFGLPLLEAALAGCGILSADLPYVYDVIKPSAVFDPEKPEEMAGVVADIILNNWILPAEIIVENKIQELVDLVNKI